MTDWKERLEATLAGGTIYDLGKHADLVQYIAAERRSAVLEAQQMRIMRMGWPEILANFE